MSEVQHKDMANAIRALSMDGVEKAKSGHPGMPMGMADVATVLYSQFMKFNAADPHWPDRDRFVLSAGHGSMLLYSLLHLTGHADFPIEELSNFRQLGARTAGHPEFGHGAGIETTTGPLGQGIATAVGMAIAEKLQAARFGSDIVDHNTYVICGDGCLMEGISHEAISMAGHLKLDKLTILFDDNAITIDGATNVAVSDDQLARFAASQWHVQRIDGHCPDEIAAAITLANASGKPSLIACKTIIGFGAPNKQGTAATHGAALGAAEIAATREALEWPHAPFEIPADIASAWGAVGSKGSAAQDAWQERLVASGKKAEFDRLSAGTLPDGWKDTLNAFKKKLSEDKPGWASRKSSQEVLNVLADAIPEMIGGSADLTGSNLTKAKSQQSVTSDDFSGAYMHYGVREHAMGAAMNGIALHGGFVPYGGTFFVFTDFCRPSIRLSALMEQRVIYVMTHDSIGLGEDGPTHQPIEHLAALRCMPNLNTFRPCDAVETAECWAISLETEKTPSVHCLSRQGLPVLRTTHTDENLSAKGGYVLAEADGERAVTLIATGSEVGLAMEARAELQKEGIYTAVVSMPCTELFDAQDADYKNSVLQPATQRVAIEAGMNFGWERYIGSEGIFVGMNSFGASAPAGDLFPHFKITAEYVVTSVRDALHL